MLSFIAENLVKIVALVTGVVAIHAAPDQWRWLAVSILGLIIVLVGMDNED